MKQTRHDSLEQFKRCSQRPRKLILLNSLSPGDVVMLTAAVRDLHRSYPGRFLTDVRTPFPDLWASNDYITPLEAGAPDVEILECHYPLIDRANITPHHCIHGFIQFLNQSLDLDIQATEFRGHIRLSSQERAWSSQVDEQTQSRIPFWVVDAGGKYDITVKWWQADRFQAVVDHFKGRIQFVQIGSKGHHHPKLDGVIDLRGKTSIRDLIRLVFHSDGALCGVTALMHLAAAVPVKRAGRTFRPCVVVAGAREPAHWEAYPDHQFIQNVGALKCALQGGCWKDRTYPLGDGDKRDAPDRLCEDVIGSLPRCMDMISPDEVIRRIDAYYAGGALDYLTTDEAAAGRIGVENTAGNRFDW